MSSSLPPRAVQLSAFRQQCLFQRPRHTRSPCAFSTSTRQAFAPSVSRLRGGSVLQQDKAITRAAAKSQVGSAPKVSEMKAQQEGAMAEDIGLLQDTFVRASLRHLPRVWSPRFWSYMWKLLKSKPTGWYSRSMYSRCIYKKGFDSYLPIDKWDNGRLKNRATKLYAQLYVNFAKGDMSSVSRFCLPPLLQSFKDRIAARGPLKMDWQLKKIHSTRVVSHRASLFGEDQPDTAYRQAVIRIESTQTLTVQYKAGAAGPISNASKTTNTKGVKWMPAEVKTRGKKVAKSGETPRDEVVWADNGKPRRVVEYLVLQIRVIKGQQEDWKVWGFTKESTPARIEEDDAYWRKTINMQAAGA